MVTNPHTYTAVSALEPQANTKVCIVSKREGFPQLAAASAAALPLRGRRQQHHARCRFLRRSSPDPMGAAIAVSRHPTAALTLALRRLRHEPGARAACLQTTGNLCKRAVRAACVCSLFRKSHQPSANEMPQSCPPNPRQIIRSELRKEALIFASHQAHPAVASRKGIKTLRYATHRGKNAFHLKTKTEERESIRCILQRAPCSVK